MFVINPDPYSLPAYRIGPFKTDDIKINYNLPMDSFVDEYLQRKFDGRAYFYTINGRSAIHDALAHYQLKPEDTVTILTTSGNFYISGCVTREIERFCKWSREIEPSTKVIFVNHEFGYPYKGVDSLKEKYGLPVIEDCCTTFFSDDSRGLVGKTGDFSIYSFPKFFPLQIGGLLICNGDFQTSLINQPEVPVIQYMKNVLSYYLKDEAGLLEKRVKNYEYLGGLLSELGLSARFPFEKGVYPSVYMFRRGHVDMDLPKLKNFFWAHGVQSSVFYGEEAFFIPVHQALTELDLDYFYHVLKYFLDQSSGFKANYTVNS